MSTDKKIDRREFIKWLAVSGGAMMVSYYLNACSKKVERSAVQITYTPEEDFHLKPSKTSEPQPLAASEVPTSTAVTPTRTPGYEESNNTARIVFVKTNNRALGIRKAIELLDIDPVHGKNVFLKPNFNSADPTPGSTHPDTLREIVAWLKEKGAEKITLGDRSGMGNTRQVMESKGIFRLGAELNIDTIVFDEMGVDDWVMIKPPDGHWKDGFPFARPCLEADILVQTCCLKTHRYGGQFTMSLKNSVGMVAKTVPGSDYNYMNELHQSPYQREMIAEINTAYIPDFIVLDGIESFISGGPAAGEKVVSEVILVGKDRIAIDAIGVALLRYHGCSTEVAQGPIFEQDQIARAVELGLGIDRPEKIELITDDSISSQYAEKIMELLLIS